MKYNPFKIAIKTVPFLLAASLLFVVAPTASAQLSAGDISVEADWPERVASGREFHARLRFRAGEGIYVYRDKIKADWEEAAGAEFLGLDMPPSETIPDLFSPAATVEVFTGKFSVTARFRTTASPGEAVRLRGDVHFQGCTDEICYAPGADAVAFEAVAVEPTEADDQPAAAAPVDGPEEPRAAPRRLGGEARTSGRWLLNLLWAFGVGFLISLTPCVLPMIPVTSAVIVSIGKNKSRLGAFALTVIYVMGLALVYASAGLLASLLGMQVQNLLNSPVVRIPLAVVFLVLALSMFDVFTFQLPDFIARRLRGKAPRAEDEVETGPWWRRALGKGTAAFGLGMVGGVVAGPCVAAPLAGMLAHLALVANPWYGFWMFFAVAWGMGLLLLVAGTAPSLLPKRGAWMVNVKKLFGILLLWAAVFMVATLVGERVYYAATSALIVVGAVFMHCFDALASDAGFWPRIGRAVGIMGVIAAALFAFAAFSDKLGVKGAAPDAPPVFRTVGPEEVDQALASGQPVVLKFWTDYCAICKVLEARLNASSAAREALQGVAALDVDAQRHLDLANRFEVIGVPALRFFGPDGQERTDLRAADLSVEEFVARVEAIKTGE